FDQLPGLELDPQAGAGVDVVADQDRAPQPGIEGKPVPVDFLDLDAVSVACQSDQGATDSPAARAEHQIVFDEGRVNVAAPVGDLVVVPEELAVRSGDADDAFFQLVNVLLDAADLGNDQGGVSASVASGTDAFPQTFPR